MIKFAFELGREVFKQAVDTTSPGMAKAISGSPVGLGESKDIGVNTGSGIPASASRGNVMPDMPLNIQKSGLRVQNIWRQNMQNQYHVNDLRQGYQPTGNLPATNNPTNRQTSNAVVGGGYDKVRSGVRVNPAGSGLTGNPGAGLPGASSGSVGKSVPLNPLPADAIPSIFGGSR